MNYISEQFVEENSYQYTLSIRCSTDGFSFMVRNDKQLLILKNIDCSAQDTVQWKLILEQESILKVTYKTVFILLEQKNKILIPENYFKADQLAQLYSMSIPLDKNETIIYNHFEPFHCYIAQGCDQEFVQCLRTHFPQAHLLSSTYSWFQAILPHLTSEQCDLFLNISQQSFDMIIIDNHELIFFNSFHYVTMTDMIYYILNTLEQLGMKTITSTYICGKYDHQIKLIETYLPEITYLGMEELMRLCNLNNYEQSYYINQSVIHQCEL